MRLDGAHSDFDLIHFQSWKKEKEEEAAATTAAVVLSGSWNRGKEEEDKRGMRETEREHQIGFDNHWGKAQASFGSLT